jgi:hypothetical protein
VIAEAVVYANDGSIGESRERRGYVARFSPPPAAAMRAEFEKWWSAAPQVLPALTVPA